MNSLIRNSAGRGIPLLPQAINRAGGVGVVGPRETPIPYHGIDGGSSAVGGLNSKLISYYPPEQVSLNEHLRSVIRVKRLGYRPGFS
jgi:hypothetical protein